MSFFSRALVSRHPPVPRHVEIWGHLEENNRFLRRFALACTAWAFLALAAASYALLVALYRPLAFHVDSEGQATLMGRLREQLAPTEPEVRYVARHFLARYVAFNSLTIESDLADAWNLMTTELRAEQERTLAQYKKEHGEEFASVIRKQGIQTVLEIDPKRVDLTDHNGKAFTVRLRGTARTWPLNRAGQDAAFSEREVEAFVTLVRCARTEQTPNGLLVAKVSSRFFIADNHKERPTDPHAGSTRTREE
jgi:hypothetical protein